MGILCFEQYQTAFTPSYLPLGNKHLSTLLATHHNLFAAQQETKEGEQGIAVDYIHKSVIRHYNHLVSYLFTVQM